MQTMDEFIAECKANQLACVTSLSHSRGASYIAFGRYAATALPKLVAIVEALDDCANHGVHCCIHTLKTKCNCGYDEMQEDINRILNGDDDG